MNNKAFTLVELLAVIAVLAIIASITSPVIINIINNSKETTYQEQIKTIERAASRWGNEHVTELSTTNCISVSELQSEGYLSSNDAEIKNPKNNQKMNGSVSITLIQNQYQYEYHDNSC